MGVLNITPDSFYAHSRASLEEVARRARQMLEHGADWIDIGGESSRPGAEPVEVEEEVRRVIPAVEAAAALAAKISVDTYHAETARRALAAGALMINDITALRGDPAMAEVVAGAGCECVLMHMLGTPQTMQREPRYNDVVDDICAFFEERIAFAQQEGIARERLWLDPGFGFGKTVSHNLEMLRRLEEFNRFGLPVLIGTSNKSTIGRVLGGLPPEERTEGTAATMAVAVMKGAAGVRVHDVRAMARVVRMTEAILHGSAEADG
jgi:dihydropteroate synthase